MTVPSRTQVIDRFRRIPALRREIWQGGVARMPVWAEPDDGGEPFRPFAAFWVSLSTGRLAVEVERTPGAHGPDLLLRALLRFARQEEKVLHGRASRLQVADAAVREVLAEVLVGTDVHVEAVPGVDALDTAVREYTAMIRTEEEWPPSMLDGRGVTVDVVRGFADAAAQYYTAAPWQHLSDEDLIEVESPDAPRGYRYALVLGNAGNTFGLAFYESPAQHEAMSSATGPEEAGDAMPVARSVIFDAATATPIDDHDLWLAHDLALAGPRAYPFAAHYVRRGKVERPGRDELAFAEAVLRALAATSEDDMDSARWKKRVTVGGRAVTVRLSLPGLLDPGRPGQRVGVDSRRRAMERIHLDVQRFLDGQQFESLEDANAALRDYVAGQPQSRREPATREERAHDLALQAYDWTGRRRLALARQALELWPDCAEAYIILAEHQATPERALPLFEQAVAAGRRAIGEGFDTMAGAMWGHLHARPYMRARLELAETLEELGREDEAVAHFQELLRLNEHDNQGVRYLLLPRLLERRRHAEAAAVLERYPQDAGATLAYCAALLAFQVEGDSANARTALASALALNRHVPKYLRAPVERFVDHYAPGSEEEALACIDEMGSAWQQTPGALEWLEKQARVLRAGRRARRRGR
jgi:tetratricopeptide (TPR) repeat protein